MESANAKGSARLLHLSIAASVLAHGEVFDPGLLHDMLYAGGKLPILLYPDTPGDQARGMPVPPSLDAGLLRDVAGLRLVVLDGTWRKSRKMLYQNPLLQALPRLPLTGMADSHYLIRKAHAPNQLSTLEASCHALGLLHGNIAAFEALLAAFDDFVAHFQQTGGNLGAHANRA